MAIGLVFGSHNCISICNATSAALPQVIELESVLSHAGPVQDLTLRSAG